MPAPKKRKVEPASNAELRVLDQLWQKAPQTIRELSTAIYGDSETSHYSTVQTLLDRLESKGWVSRDRSVFRHTFRPTRERADLVGQQIQQVANSVCNGSVAALLGLYAKTNPLSAREREELRKLIEEGEE